MNDYAKGYKAGFHEAIAEMKIKLFYEINKTKVEEDNKVMQMVFRWLDKMEES